MNIDDQKTFALKACIEIAQNITREQVEILPVQFIQAHSVGAEYLDHMSKENKKSLRDFTL